MSEHECRVYLGCLHCYNEGRLHGGWFEIDEHTTPEDLSAELDEFFGRNERGFAKCGGEEFVVHDHEGFSPYNLGEVSPPEAARTGAIIAEHGPFLVSHALEYVSEDPDEVRQWIEEHYRGAWDSERDFAEQLAEDLDLVPREHSWPASYIDWEAAARDLFISDYRSVRDDETGEVHVFDIC